MPARKDDREIRGRTMASAPPRHDEDLCRHIADRAYELFLERGARHGQDLEDWLEAERQVMAGSQARPEAEKRAAPAAPRLPPRTAPRPVAVAKPARRRTLDT